IHMRFIPEDCDLVVAVFSRIRAWKGGTGTWLRNALAAFGERARVFISFGNPYIIKNIKNATRIYAYWDSESAQKAVAEKLISSGP
ncbi:MAG TPA: hypothetical protein VN328_12060, partial [Thermodesulfovibrionales bacterium]|nr:hypothetical protein [Thermodesulfovibrionales bacterium]